MKPPFALKPLVDLAEVAAGQAAPQGREKFNCSGTPFIRAGSLEGLLSGGSEDDCEHVTDQVADDHGLRLFPRDTILFAKSGMSAKIGRVYRLTKPAFVVSHLAAIVPDKNIYPSYLQRWLEANPPSRLIPNDAYPSIRLSAIETLEIPIPFPDDPRRSLAEQKRIAAILDKADAVRRRRSEAEREVQSLVPSVFYDMFGDPTFNPHQITECRLEEVAEKVTDGEHLTPRRTSSGIKLLSARNVKNGFIDLDEAVDYIDDEEYARIIRRCDPRQGDVLISCSGTVGRVTMVRIDEPFTLVRSAAMVRPNLERILPEYLEAYLQTEYAQRAILRGSNKSSQANIFLGPIKALPVLVPELKRQEEFAGRTDECRRLAEQQRSIRGELDDLFGSLVQRAFHGEL